MIIKGKSRSRGSGLAKYLLRAGDNERVELLGIEGTIASDLLGALREMEALGEAAISDKPLYHAFISPPADRPLTPEQRNMAVEALEKRMGLTGQPRAVVLHKKDGREHLHVVWCRVDVGNGKVISDSWNYLRHEQVSRELERAFGHEPVQGAHAERQGRPRPERTPELAEMRQAERAGINKVEVAHELTRIWWETDTGREFRAELEYAGYLLARGDRRTFVVLDPAGETHSLSRRVDGVRAKDVRERLADLAYDQLPTVEAARGVLRDRVADMRAEMFVDQRFEREALRSQQDMSWKTHIEKADEFGLKAHLFRRLRVRLDKQLEASLYSRADYVTMSMSAIEHLKDRVRVRESYKKGVAARYWAERIPAWIIQRQSAALANLGELHAMEGVLLDKTGRRHDQQTLAELKRFAEKQSQLQKRREKQASSTAQASKQSPSTGEKPAYRTRQQRERDDLLPSGELSEAKQARVEKAVDHIVGSLKQKHEQKEAKPAKRGKDYDLER